MGPIAVAGRNLLFYHCPDGAHGRPHPRITCARVGSVIHRINRMYRAPIFFFASLRARISNHRNPRRSRERGKNGRTAARDHGFLPLDLARGAISLRSFREHFA